MIHNVYNQLQLPLELGPYLSFVPAQHGGDGVEPVAGLLVAADDGHWVAGDADVEGVPAVQLLGGLAVEVHVPRATRVHRHGDALQDNNNNNTNSKSLYYRCSWLLCSPHTKLQWREAQ